MSSDTKNILEENESLKAEVEELKATIASHEADYDELVKERDELATTISIQEDDEKPESQEDEDEEAQDEEDAQEDEDKEASAEDEEEAEEDDDTEASALKRKVAKLEQKLVTFGIEPIVTKPDAETKKTPEQAREEFGSITDWRERSQFFKKNRELLTSK